VSGIYLYCFTPPGTVPGADLAGVCAGLVTHLALPWLTVWLEETDDVPRADLETIRRHDAVVRAAWAATPACLPVRFGQWFAEAGALEKTLTERRMELERALTTVADAGEHGIRITETDPTTEAEAERARPSTGRAYLEWLQARMRRDDARARRVAALGEELEASLGPAIRAQRLDVLPAGQGLASVAHLVPIERAEAYAEGIRAFGARHPELGLLETGPWPPYSFAP
jgi:hypothetical protein